MYIMGIETSCDETAAAVIEGNRGNIKVLSNIISSQIDIHKKYGGVVPEVAAREHVTQILPVIDKALEKAGVKIAPLSRACPERSRGDVRPVRRIGGSGRGAGGEGLDAIAVTIGPGLITSLIVGIETAKVLSYAWNVPVIGINHIEGHIYANFIGENSNNQKTNSPGLAKRSGAGKKYPKSKKQIPKIKFPALILTVSGGHTMLVMMKGHGDYQTIGETRDDAAGEAFDKAANLLGLGYPGGPVISKYADKFRKQHSQIFKSQATPAATRAAGQANSKKNPNSKSQISLPRPMIDRKNFDFSFSGLKTALLYSIQKDKNWKKRIPEYAHEFQQAIIDVLIYKTLKAAEKYKVKTIMLAGGVAANTELRKQLKIAVKKHIPKSQFLIPDLKYTTDNAPMIATASYYHALRKDYTPWQKLKVNCNLELK